MFKLTGEKLSVVKVEYLHFFPSAFTNQVMHINMQKKISALSNKRNCPAGNQLIPLFSNICWGWTNIYLWKVHFCATNTQRHPFLGAYRVFTSVFEFLTEIQTYLLPRGTNNLQKENKDLDDVDIEGKSSKDILIFGDGVLPVSYQKLCVVGQELHRNI